MEYATSLLNTDPDRIRKAVMRRFSPLDGIGKDLTDCKTYDEALTVSGLGFEPQSEQLIARKGKDEFPVPGYKAIYNGVDHKALLSVVKEDYTVVDNREAFAIAEDLVTQDGFRYEVSNIVKDGARCRLVLAGPEVEIAGEAYTPYAVLNNSFDLSRSISIQFMFMRIVCLNGLMRKAPGVSSSIFLTHFGEKEAKLNRLRDFRISFDKTLEYLRKEASVLQATPLTKDEFRQEIVPLVVDHVFQRPANAPLTDRQLARTQSFVESVLSAYDATDTANFNGTAYKVLLTMTDLDSHISPFVKRNNPDVYINRVLQAETIMSMANLVANHIIKTRKLHI